MLYIFEYPGTEEDGSDCRGVVFFGDEVVGRRGVVCPCFGGESLFGRKGEVG